jgi:hypothetical protein
MNSLPQYVFMGFAPGAHQSNLRYSFTVYVISWAVIHDRINQLPCTPVPVLLTNNCLPIYLMLCNICVERTKEQPMGDPWSCSPPKSPKSELKESILYILYQKFYVIFTLQPKSGTEIA